jgi:Uma2 family endonuclease
MALPKGARYLADYIWESPDDSNRYEVIDGKLYVTPAPILPHQDASGNLFGFIWTHVRNNELGYVWAAPVGVVLDRFTAVQPDIVYVSAERAGIRTLRGIEGAPDLVVEILSPSTRARDRGLKLSRYATAGIPHYWIVDPRHRTLEALELEGGEYQLRDRCEGDQLFCPVLFPGLEIPLAQVWA